MSEPPRDSLAEHPLGTTVPKRRPRSGMLDLFPDIGELPLSSAPASPGATPPPRPPAAADSPPAEHAAARDVTGFQETDDPGDPLEASGESESPGVAFARRVAAGLADLLILALVGAVELAAGALLLELRFPPAALVPLGAFLLLAAIVLLVLAPFVWGTTPGMALADLRIRADDGGSPTLVSSFLRFTGFLLTGALAGVPLLVAAFDRRGRTLSDLLSRTTVVGAERGGGGEAV